MGKFVLLNKRSRTRGIAHSVLGTGLFGLHSGSN